MTLVRVGSALGGCPPRLDFGAPNILYIAFDAKFYKKITRWTAEGLKQLLRNFLLLTVVTAILACVINDDSSSFSHEALYLHGLYRMWNDIYSHSSRAQNTLCESDNPIR